MLQELATDSPFIVILDEMGYYDQTGDDKLKIMLRDVKGIENAEYAVHGNMIFVFDKLVEMVREYLKEHPSADVCEFAPGMVAGATIPIEEAVKEWGIVPLGFRAERSGSGFHIWHTELMARIPKDFDTMADVNAAYVALLKGQKIPGEGTFAYDSQNLIFTYSMDPDLLPGRPVPLRKCPKPKHVICHLDGTAFYPGYSPVGKARFARIQSVERKWVFDRESIRSDAMQNADKIWALMEHFSWDACSEECDDIPEYGMDELAGLRKFYPGLKKLSDSALYHHFDAFEFGCRSARNWQANLDEGFMFYMLGEAARCTSGDHVQEEFGEFLGHAILSGLAIRDAFDWAERAEAYNKAVGKLAWRTDSAMRFLKSEKTRKPGTGREVFTFTDLCEKSRSCGPAPVFFLR